jgi:uncharacterized protein YukE
MTILHMQTETVRNTAQGMKQSSEAMSAEMQALRASVQRLVTAWDSSASDQFQGEADDLLRQLMRQQESLSILAERVTREVQEWEDVDNRGSQSMRAGASFAAFGLPTAGGLGSLPFLNGSAILPLFTAISAIPLLSGLPAWLNSFLDKFFVPPAIVSPVPSEVEGPIAEGTNTTEPGALQHLINEKLSAKTKTTFGDLLNESPQATESAKPAEPPKPAYDTSYDVPAKSQGALYGSAACLPTSMSMALDYYHTQDSANQTASPDTLIGMLDKGDGTWGSGIGLDKMNDDLGELGYKTTVNSGNMDDLSTALKGGPVIVNSQVVLVSVPARDIIANGSVNHAILVKAINSDSVVVNDPWSGTEKTFSRPTFEKMWNGGSNYMIVVRPAGGAQ